MTSTASPKPVTVLVTRRVRRGRAAEFERLMTGMQASAAGFPGHMGGFLIPPEGAVEDGCYRTLFAFDTEAHLQAWTFSQERQRWLRRIAQVTHGDAATRVLTGLETWFALPAASTKSPPPRWKMAVATWLGICPLVLLATYTATPLLGRWLPVPLVVALITALIVAAMTWLVMPVIARVLARWLYPPSTDAPPLQSTTTERT